MKNIYMSELKSRDSDGSHRTGLIRLSFKGIITLAIVSLLPACTTSVKEQPYREYLNVAPATSFGSVSSDPRLTGLIGLLSNFNKADIETLETVYSDPLYFNDTFHTFHSRDELKRYLLTLADQADIRVTFLDAEINGNNGFIRWSMTMKFSVWWKEIEIESIGTTHIRFDSQGKITLHQDYWDGASGFYAQLPLLGSILKYIRRGLGESNEM